MVLENLDPCGLGDSEDAAILSLFRQWIDGQRAIQLIVDESENGDLLTAENDRLDNLTCEIDDLPVRGIAGLAIKSYLAIHSELYAFESGNDSAGLRRLTMGGYHGHSVVAMLRDAARFVPEIAQFVPPAEPNLPVLRERVAAIVAEFDVPLPEGDAGLAEAHRRLHEMAERTKALYREFDEITPEIEGDEITPHRDRVVKIFDDMLTDTEPQTLAGAAEILRYLLGVHGNDLLNDADAPIANVLAVVEREIAAKGGAA
jgi:hypothetical protein